jgi:hypothetical protein
LKIWCYSPDPHPEAKPGESARDILSFKRRPTWMWANTEVEELVEWGFMAWTCTRCSNPSKTR